MIPNRDGRYLVPDDEDRGVIPPDLLDRFGSVLLPACWSPAEWHNLQKHDKVFVYRAVADFPYWFWYIYFPFKSKMEMGYNEEQIRELYPNGPPRFWIQYLRDIQASIPHELTASEKKPVHDPVWRLAYAEPTGFFKSARTCEALPLWLMGVNPSVTVVIAMAKKENGDRFISAFDSHIRNNEQFIYVHGRLRTDNSEGRWASDVICVDRPLQRSAPTVELVGALSRIEGERYDVGLVDDLLDVNSPSSELFLDRMWDWLTGAFTKRLNADRRLVVFIGTPHYRNDPLDRIKQEAATKGTWKYRETPAIVGGTWPPLLKDPDLGYTIDNVIVPDDLETLWPEFWTPAKLVEDFVEDPRSFARTRMLLYQDPESRWFSPELVEDCKADGGPRSDGGVKPMLSRWPEDIGVPEPGSGLYEQYMHYGFDPDALVRVISVDLAPGSDDPRRHNLSDYTVFQLWGMDKQSSARILLNQLRRRTRDPLQLERALSDWVHAYKPHKLLVEAVAVEKLYARKLQDVVGFPVKIKDVKSRKIEDIETFRDMVQSRMIWIPWANDTHSQNTGRNYNTRYVFQPFVEELIAYPHGAHDDTLMAAVHAISELRGRGGEITARVIGSTSPQEQMESKVRAVMTRSEPSKELEKEIDYVWGLAQRIKAHAV